MTAAMVDQAVSWGWWVIHLATLGMGVAMGWWIRSEVQRDRDEDDFERAQRAARVYHDEIQRARRRHPSHG